MSQAAARPTRLSKENPARDLKWEKILDDREFTYILSEVQLSAIDETRSQQNQARIGKPIDDDLVAQYTIALEAGDEFPAIILADQSPRKMLVVDGNHRYAAHKNSNRTKIWAYIISGASHSAITLLTYEANAKHGKMTSQSERLEQALHLIDGNVSAEEAARRLGLPVSKVRDASNLNRVDQRADECGISRVQWDKLPAASKKRLGQITTDEGFAAAAKLALDAGLKSDAVTKIVGDLNQPTMRSSARQAAHVSQLRSVYRDSIQTGGTRQDKAGIGKQARSPRVLYGMCLQQITVLPSASSITAKMSEGEKVEWMRRTEDALDRLKGILDVLRR
jgi:hypothetical protein